MIADNFILKLKGKSYYPIIRNVVWLSLDKFFKLFLSLVVGIWVARLLGPETYGELNYVLAIMMIITTISNLGMDSFLIKEILSNEAEKNRILGTAFFMRLISIPIVFLFVLCYFFYLDLNAQYYYIFALLSLGLLISPLELIDIDFQSQLQSKQTIIAKNSASIIGVLIKIYFLLNNKSLLWFVAATSFETFLSYAFLLYRYQTLHSIFNWEVNYPLVKKILSIGWPFIISNLAVILYMRVDQIMIGNMVGEKELGIFSSAIRITENFLFIPTAIASSFFPTLVNAKKNSTQTKYLYLIQAYLIWTTRLAVIIALSTSMLSKFIIQTLFGIEYLDAYKVLIIHVWSLVPIFLGVASSQYLVIENLQNFNLYKTTIGLISNVLLNIILIPLYGALGAAIATLISYGISAIIGNCFFTPTRPLFQMLLKSLLLFNNAKYQSTN